MTFCESMRLTDKMNEALHKKQPAREENYYRTLARVLLGEKKKANNGCYCGHRRPATPYSTANM